MKILPCKKGNFQIRAQPGLYCKQYKLAELVITQPKRRSQKQGLFVLFYLQKNSER